MSEHPINLAFRFFLEIAALIVMGYWGWQRGGVGPLRFILALAIPLVAAVLWGTFRVPGDPGSAPVAVAGPVRLVLEVAFFVFAVWTLYDSGKSNLGWVFGIILLLHYLISYDRIFWLLKNKEPMMLKIEKSYQINKQQITEQNRKRNQKERSLFNYDESK